MHCNGVIGVMVRDKTSLSTGPVGQFVWFGSGIAGLIHNDLRLDKVF